LIGQEKEAALTGPEMAEGIVSFEDVRSVGPEAAVPRAVNATVHQVHRFLRVEEQRGASGELTIDENKVR
jgi:hypothetical protein